jgi:hypothetical protein
VIRVHPIRHDRSREPGAFANPKRTAPPQNHRRLMIMSPTYRTRSVARVPVLDSAARRRPRRTRTAKDGPGLAASRRHEVRMYSQGIVVGIPNV